MHGLDCANRRVKSQNMPPAVRRLTESAKRIVAHRQDWKCSECRILLPAAFQVDHTTPLCDGGDDHIDNCSAMCANCHAKKTQLENMRRVMQARNRAAKKGYDTREDVAVNGQWVCTLCHQSRPKHLDHLVCPAIDDPQRVHRTTFSSLARFSFVSRH